MNCIIPFESKVKFNNPIKEICSISLEHELTKNDDQVLGSFIISGTYKEHELSVNTSDFKFTIPFNVELANRIEMESLEFSIDNFTYEIDNDEMTVKIDYIVTADDVREEVITENPQDNPLELIEEIILPEKNDNIIELPMQERKVDDVSFEETKVSEKEEIREEIDTEIINGVETENDYITYHIHIVKETETMESIALTYKISKEELETINGITSIFPNDKLIIPITNE